MNLLRVFKTTAIKISIRYALLYVVIMLISFIVIEIAISSYINHQITRSLKREIQQFIRIDAQESRKDLIKIVERKTRIDSKLHQRRDYYWLLISKNGKKIAGNLNEWPTHLTTDPDDILNIITHPGGFTTLGLSSFFDKDHHSWPTVTARLSDGAKVLVAKRIQQADDLQGFIFAEVGIVLLLSIFLSLFLGWRLGTKMLNKLDKINKVLKNIAENNLSQRIPLLGQYDEFDDLISHLNAMLSRIESLFNGMQEVTDNIAHDLRQPLSRLRNRIEVALLETRDKKSYKNTLEKSIEDIEKIINTFNALLEIAQTKAGSNSGDWIKMNLSQIVRNLSDLYNGSAERKNIKITCNIESELFIVGNEHLISQSISNLLDNAIKYTPIDGVITLCVYDEKNKIILSISDTGIGIQEKYFEYVQKRFVRLDVHRSTPGNGLGLSLVKAVVNLHKAKMIFSNNNPGLVVNLYFNHA